VAQGTTADVVSGASLCHAVRACFTTEMLEATALGDECALGAGANADAPARAGEIVPTAADPAASTTAMRIAVNQRANESIPTTRGWKDSRKVSVKDTPVVSTRSVSTE
jgi:hypothetical protein